MVSILYKVVLAVDKGLVNGLALSSWFQGLCFQISSQHLPPYPPILLCKGCSGHFM